MVSFEAARVTTVTNRNGTANELVWYRRERWLWAFDIFIVGVAVLLIALARDASMERIGEFGPSRKIVAEDHRLSHQTFDAPQNTPTNAATVIRGTRRNQGNAPSDLVRVVAHFLDNAGQPVRKAIGDPTLRSIPAHGTTEFIVVTYADSRIVDYKL